MCVYINISITLVLLKGPPRGGGHYLTPRMVSENQYPGHRGCACA